MPAGHTAYVTVDVRPGEYAWVAEINDPLSQGFLETFSVPASAHGDSRDRRPDAAPKPYVILRSSDQRLPEVTCREYRPRSLLRHHPAPLAPGGRVRADRMLLRRRA